MLIKEVKEVLNDLQNWNNNILKFIKLYNQPWTVAGMPYLPIKVYTIPFHLIPFQ